VFQSAVVHGSPELDQVWRIVEHVTAMRASLLNDNFDGSSA
jgi:hypothetical protein